MKNFLFQNFGRNIIMIVFPFFLYFISKEIFPINNRFQLFTGALIFYIFLLITIFYFLTYQTEHILDFLNEKDSKLTFIIRIIFYILCFSLAFASYYHSIYLYDRGSFSNVVEGGFLDTYCDFFYYSTGTFLINNNSSIMAETIFAKILSGSEILSSFVSIIVILANYESLKDPINDVG